MVQGVDQKLSIQGSSLKGCIRSVYEAITNSTLAVITNRYRDKIPQNAYLVATKNNFVLRVEFLVL